MKEGARKKEEYPSMPDEPMAYRETDHHRDGFISCRQPSAYLTPQRLKQGVATNGILTMVKPRSTREPYRLSDQSTMREGNVPSV